ncbi:uncharacterized protein LOC144440299 [Glandiceps talaboti]
MVLSEAKTGSPNLASTGDLCVRPGDTKNTNMQASTVSAAYPCMCPGCPPAPLGYPTSPPSAAYHHGIHYPIPVVRTTAVTVLQSSLPLTASAHNSFKTYPVSSSSLIPKFSDGLREIHGTVAAKRPRDCGVPNCTDCLQDENVDHSKRQRTNYSPYTTEKQGLYGSTPVTPVQGVVDSRTSLLTAAECHLATLQDEDGDTPLHIAIAQSNLPLVERLVQLVAMSAKNVDIYNHLRQTPLHLAVITNQWQMVRLLMMAGADVNLTDRNGQTSIHLACQRSNMECLHSLMSCSRYPIDLNAKNYEGFTAIHVAVLLGSLDVISFLVSKGSDINSTDGKSGRTPLFHAVENDRKDVIELLLQHNADVNAQSYSGNTALHVASGRGLISVVRSLLRHGADMSMKNYHSDTAVTVAKDTSVSKVLHNIYRPGSQPHQQVGQYNRQSPHLHKTHEESSKCVPLETIKTESGKKQSCMQSQKNTTRVIKRVKREKRLSSSDEGFSSRPSSVSS